MVDPLSAAGLQRRQFGRREIARAASALLPGGATVACTVNNMSEAGALVEFAGAAVPTRNFRLMIDGAPHTLLCEIRHQGPTSVGVRFVNAAEAQRVMAHLFPGPPLAGDAEANNRSAREPIAAAPAITTRDLRQKVLSSMAERAAAAPSSSPPPIQKLLPSQLWTSFANFTRKTGLGGERPVDGEANSTTTEAAAPPAAVPAPEVAPRLPLPDEAFRGYQPKRSRRNGIKGKSAGGIG